MYDSEKDMYPPVATWLENFLTGRFKRHQIIVNQTPQTKLYRWLETRGFAEYFPDYLTYDIKVDIVGLACYNTNARLFLVECKLNRISLKDVSQLLGYSRVAQPHFAIILSPAGISRPLDYLLRQYGRFDVLNYGEEERKRLRIAQWDDVRETISVESLLPPGEHL